MKPTTKKKTTDQRLRIEFALAVLPGLISLPHLAMTKEQFAEAAFAIADACVAESKKGPKVDQ